VLRAELPRSICAIHLKPIVATIGRNQPEVVQHGAAKRGFFVNHDAAEASDSETAEYVGSKTMSAEKLR